MLPSMSMLLNSLSTRGFTPKNKKTVVDLIKGIRKDCSDLESYLSLAVRKCLDFKAKGLTEQKAWDLAGNWLFERFYDYRC